MIRKLRYWLGKYAFAMSSISYGLLASIFFYPFFFGKTIFYLDNLLHMAPAFEFWRAQIWQGNVPLWNPYIFAGIPFLADSSHAVFSPFNLFYLLPINIFQVITFQAILLIVIASLGTRFLARRVGLSNFSSWWVGFFYGFSGAVFDLTGDVNALTAVVLLPWVLGVFVATVVKKQRFFSWPLSVMLALMLLSAHTQYWYYAVLVMGLGLCLLWSKRAVKDHRQIFRPIMGFALTIVLALGLSAVQLLPSLELITATARTKNIAGAELDLTLAGTRLAALPTIFWPRIFGTYLDGNSWGPGSQQERGLASPFLVLSLSSLFFAGIAFGEKRQRGWVIFIGLLAVGTFWLSFGEGSWLFRFFYSWLPGFKLFRSPFRIIILYSLSISLLAGWGIEYLARKKQKHIPSWFLVANLVLLISVVAWAVIYYFNLDLVAQGFTFFYEQLRQAPLEESLSYSKEKVLGIAELVAQSGILLGVSLLGLVWLWLAALKRQIWPFLVALALIGCELFWGIRGTLFFADPTQLKAGPEVVSFLQENLGPSRYASTGEIEPFTGIWVYFNHLSVRPPFSKEQVTDQELNDWKYLQDELSMLPNNVNQLSGLKSTTGYVALLPKEYRDYLDSQRVNHLNFKRSDSLLLDKFSTKYLVTGVPFDALADKNDDRFIKVLESGGVIIYENKTAKPRLDFVDGQSEEIAANLKLIEDKTEQVVITAEVDKPGTLVLRDFWYPGWNVFVDGKEQGLSRFDTIFRAVALPSGKHKVVFSYQPLSFRIGLIISGISSLFLIGLICLKRRKR